MTRLRIRTKGSRSFRSRSARRRRASAAGLALVVAALVTGCGSPAEERLTAVPAPETAAPEAAPTEPPGTPSGPADWVRVYDPQRAASGYTLVLYRQRLPVLIDMNGRWVHSWPGARVKSRVRLLADGSLLGIALGRGVAEYDWGGNLQWRFDSPERLPHHDVIRLANGNTMLIVLAVGGRTDDLLEVDRQGQIVWEWHAAEHLAPFFDRAGNRGDITHINSIQELPANPLHQRGDDRFRPGNLLLSARNLSTVFVIDRRTGEAVWSYNRDLDFQHEAWMIGPGLPGHGRILLFNNRYRSFYGDRQSSIVEVDGASAETTWHYQAAEFFSPTGGVEQPLVNGNVLVGSTRGGRAFEITRDGEIVWEWVPPFDPRRPRRYAYDHCPQLAALDRPRETAVAPPADYRHVDHDVYRFSRRGRRRKVKVEGEKMNVLTENNDCREITLPRAATAEVEYGLDPRLLRRAGRGSYRARFGLRLRLVGVDESETQLLDDTVDVEAESWRRRSVDLTSWALRRVVLCVETAEVGADPGVPTEEFAYWAGPWITAGGAAPALADEGAAPADDLTDEELAAQIEHLRALGYVD